MFSQVMLYFSIFSMMIIIVNTLVLLFTIQNNATAQKPWLLLNITDYAIYGFLVSQCLYSLFNHMFMNSLLGMTILFSLFLKHKYRNNAQLIKKINIATMILIAAYLVVSFSFVLTLIK